MRWFKYYSSLHQQPESQATIRKMGFDWFGRYAVLLALCASQYNDDDPRAPIVLLADSLRTELRVAGDWLSRLRLLGEYQGFTFEVVGEFIKFNIPILSELRHKDSTSSKNRRATLGTVAGPRIRNKNKEEEKEYIEEKPPAEFDFEKAFELYPLKIKGPNAEKKFCEQIVSSQDFTNLITALLNYKNHLSQPENSWRKPKQSFAAFLGSKATGFFWKDWVNSDAGASSISNSGTKTNIDEVDLTGIKPRAVG